MKRARVMMGVVIAAALFATGSQIAGATDSKDGKVLYDKICGMCHNMMPPKLGDKEAWAPRIAKGEDALVESVIKGKPPMPPRGGNPSFTDTEIRAAVKYMVEKSK